MYSKAKKGWPKHIDFTIIDIISLEIALVLSYAVRMGLGTGDTIYIYEQLAVLLPFMHICVMFFTEGYSGILQRGYLQGFKAVIKHNSLLFAIILAYMFLTKQSAEYSRAVILSMWAVSSFLMYYLRIIRKQYLYDSYAMGKNKSHMLILTTRKLAESTLEPFLSSKYSDRKIRGIILTESDTGHGSIKGVPVVATLENMIEYVRTHLVDEVFVNLAEKEAEYKDITKRLLDMGVTVHINLDLHVEGMPNRMVEEINGYTVMTTSIKMATPRQLFLTRATDIIAGIIGLFATGLAFIIFAPIIYIQSPGPIFFYQERMGKNGRRFHIIKFRTMYMDAEERKKELLSQNKMNGLMFKVDNDPRVTPIGRFLRKTSIDELPQSINILKGEMALVGTRPPTVDEYEKYELHHKSRLAAKPGLTGMWQVSGRSDITDFEEVVKLDTEYIKNWSLGLDLKIILKTFGVVFRRVGAE